MNDVLRALSAHRSIRRYTPDDVAEADVHAAIAAGQAASTSSAIQSYCIIRVRDEAAREQLVELTGGQTKVARCGAFFVVCGDTRRHRLAAERDGHAHDARLEAFLLATIDASLFAQNVCVAFESMGYGICYIGGLRNQLPDVDALLEIPEGVYPLYGLCVGRPDETPTARPRLPLDAVLFDDRYPADADMLERMSAYDETYRTYLAERGAEPAAWSERMAAKFSQPERTNLAAYYTSKGADLG